MKPVSQTIFGLEEGNCFAACVASILELTIEEVPNFCLAPGEWFVAFEEWLADRGLLAISLGDDTSDEPVDIGMYTKLPCIACGDYEGPTGNGPHAVVYERGELAHNPNPKHEGRDLAFVNLVVFLVRGPTDGGCAHV